MGRDIRDLYVHLLKTLSNGKVPKDHPTEAAVRLRRIVQDALKPVSASKSVLDRNKGPKSSKNGEKNLSEAKDCQSFKELGEAFQEGISYFPDSMVDALLCTLATIATVLPQSDSIDPEMIRFAQSDPVWIYLVGPPGSGKTMILEACSYNHFAKPISKITGLTSGMKGDTKDGDDGTSPIHWFNMRAVLVKDYTYILSQPQQAQDNLFGELRDAFDKKIRNYYRNGKLVEIDFCYFAMICGVTDEIRSADRATLGERFLAVEALADDHNPKKHIHSALSHLAGQFNIGEGEQEISANKLHNLRLMVNGFLNHLNNRMSSPEFRYPTCNEEFLNKIASLGEFCESLRSKVKRDKHQDPLFRPRVGIGTRLSGQLLKLGIALCIVLDKSQIDREVYHLLHKVALDTLDRRSYVYCLVEALGKNVDRKQGLSQKQIAAKIHTSEATVGRILKNMLDLKIVQKESVTNGLGVGRNSHLLQLTPQLKRLWRDLQ